MTVRTSTFLSATMFMTSARTTWPPSAESAVTSEVGYNRAFACPRDHITVLNVLLASERRPLQFSTFSSVQRSIKTETSVKIPFTRIIARGVDSISPEVIAGSNPVVSIIPLSTEEFIREISRPIEPQLIDDLLAQGWKKEVVLPLVADGVVSIHWCAEHLNPAADFIQLNDGDDMAKDRSPVHPRRNDCIRPCRAVRAYDFASNRQRPNNVIESITLVVQNGSGPEEAWVTVVVPGNVRGSCDDDAISPHNVVSSSFQGHDLRAPAQRK